MKIKPELIIKACEESNSMAEAASLFDINFQTFRKYAKELGVWKPNASGKGLKKTKSDGRDKYSLKEIIKILQELSNKKFNINFGKIAYHKFQIMDPFNVKKLPKWNAKISLKNGLKIIVN